MPHHAPGHQKYCGQWSWNVEPQKTQECCCIYFADVRWSDSWGFVLPVSQMCREVSISGRICNRRDSRLVKADLTLFDISFTECLTSTYGFGRWYGLKGNIGYVFKILIHMKYCLYLHNSRRISWVEWEKKTEEVHHDWILTIQVGFVVKNISDPVV